MTSQPLEHIHPNNTGGSGGSQFASRNPYRDDSAEEGASRNPYWTPQESPSSPLGNKPEALSSHPTHQVGMSNDQDDIYSAAPPLPARPDYDSQASPGLAHGPERTDSPHPGFTAPSLPPRPEQDDYVFRDGHIISPGTSDDFSPPRRRLTTGDIPVTSLGYARNPERVVAYLIPLPAPTRQGQVMQVPQRYMIYTPPAPHLLKPQGKEGKRHKLKRLAQQEVKKAKTFEGKKLSFRGLHSKTLRGCDWAVAAIKNADITFLNRVPRKQVNELILIHPASVLQNHTPEDVHQEFTAQLARTKRKAATHSVISVALFPPAIAIDTLAVIFWPFGGLAEIDGVWAYASLSGYLTARSVTKRLDKTPITTPSASEQRQLRRELHGDGPEDAEQEIFADPPRRESRQVHFQEELDEEDEKLRGNNAEAVKDKLKIRFVPDEAMATMANYFQEICHKRDPRAFPSSGVPPTKTDVLASIGWWPDRRGRARGVEHEGDWDDENWQTRQVKEDLDKVMKKAAKSWDKWCKAYAKYPQRAMKEKGHSRTSEVLRKLHIKKGVAEEKRAAGNSASNAGPSRG